MQHDYRELLTRLVRHYRACETWQFYAALSEAEGLMDAYTENAAWCKEADEALELAKQSEPFPLDAINRDPGPPDEPSDLEPGELPGADESTTEARVTVNQAHGGMDTSHLPRGLVPDLDPPDWRSDIREHQATLIRKAAAYDKIRALILSEAGS